MLSNLYFLTKPPIIKARSLRVFLYVIICNRVPPHYDSMVAKLIVFGRTRNAALMRLRRALEEFVIEGVETTIPLHQRIIKDFDFIDGQYNIHWLEHYMESRKK